MHPPNGQLVLELLSQLGIALGIGVLIGLERQLSHRDQSHGVGGIRTFALVAVFGFLATLPDPAVFPWLQPASLVALTALLSVRYTSHLRDGQKGITTELSLFITFILGMLVHLQYSVFAVAVALLMSFLLSLKPKIQEVVQRITEEELFAIFKFLVASVLVLPLLPDRTIDPWAVLNPREVWTVVVLVLSLSLIGYILVKFWSSQQGILVTGFIGGLVSSTVVTWLFSNRSKRDPQNSQVYALATLLAISIMFARIFVLTEVVNAGVGRRMFLPLAMLFFTGVSVTYVLYRRSMSTKVEAPDLATMGNPFNMADAVKFALMFSVIIILVSVANSRFGSAGVYAVSALSGLASVDAIIVSMARLAGSQVLLHTALNAILIAALSNNVVKLMFALVRGSPQYKRTVGLGISLIFAVAAFWSAALGW
jgi:uncharacterized membrane protein (DUF4010 family)